MGGTGLLRNQPWYEQLILGFLLRRPYNINWLSPELGASLKEDSAETMLRLVEDPGYAAQSPLGEVGEQGDASYFDPNGKQIETMGDTVEHEKAKRLWEETARLLGYSGEKALG